MVEPGAEGAAMPEVWELQLEHAEEVGVDVG